MTDLEQKMESWEKRDAELDREMELFEGQYKHTKPCRRYIETGYCTHLVNAQQRKFGKDADALIADLASMAKK